MWVENWEFGVLLASKVERELLRKIWMQCFFKVKMACRISAHVLLRTTTIF
jgi:hypothetical protein